MIHCETFNQVKQVTEFEKARVRYKGALEIYENGSPVILDRHEAKQYLTDKYVGDHDPVEIDMSYFGAAHNGNPVRL